MIKNSRHKLQASQATFILYIISSYVKGNVKKFKSKFHVFGWFLGLQNLDVLWKIYCVESFEIIFQQKWFIMFVMVSCSLVNLPIPPPPYTFFPNLFKPQDSPQSQCSLIPRNSGGWRNYTNIPLSSGEDKQVDMNMFMNTTRNKSRTKYSFQKAFL